MTDKIADGQMWHSFAPTDRLVVPDDHKPVLNLTVPTKQNLKSKFSWRGAVFRSRYE